MTTFPKHVHVEYGAKERSAKIRFEGRWVLLSNNGFSQKDLSAIIKKLKEVEIFLHDEWERIINDEQ